MTRYPSSLQALAHPGVVRVHLDAEGWIAYEAGDALPALPQDDGVPLEVSRRQARQALRLAGKLDLVQLAIDAIADPLQRGMMQDEWDESVVFQRHRPSLLQMGAAIGLTDADMDQLFILAGSL
jgi:hypothetical protein